MNLDDIDTPVDEALLGGEGEAAAAAAAASAAGQAAEQDAESGEADAVPVGQSDRAGAEPDKERKKEPEHERERSQQIPRERFDEVNAKLKAERETREVLEAELAAFRQPRQEELPQDLVDLERQAMAALIEGDGHKSLSIRAEINAALLRQAEERVEQRLNLRDQEQAIARQEALFRKAVANTLESYPMLDSASGNREAIDEVVEWRDFYINKGMPWHQALHKAAERVMPSYGGAASDGTGPETRKEGAIRRNAAAANAQPAAPEAGVGTRSVPMRKAPEKQEDWEKLPAAERERMLA
jgi:hypothetical protein